MIRVGRPIAEKWREKESLTNNAAAAAALEKCRRDAGRADDGAQERAEEPPRGEKEKVDEFWSMMSEGSAAYRRLHVRRDAAIKPPRCLSLSLFGNLTHPRPAQHVHTRYNRNQRERMRKNERRDGDRMETVFR